MPDSSANSTTARPIRRISSWKVFGVFCLVSFLFLLGLVFIPWDIKPVAAPDLEVQIPKVALEENAFTWFGKAGDVQVVEFPDGPNDRERSWSEELTGSIGSEQEKWDPVFASDVLVANAAVFPNLEKGLACQIYVPPKVEFFCMNRPWMIKPQRLSLLLILKSKQMHLDGSYTESVKLALQTFHLGEMIADTSNCEDDWMLGLACEYRALERLEELVADPRISAQLLAEIQFALDQWKPDGMIEGYKNAMRGEYASMVQTVKGSAAGKYQEWYFGEIKVASLVPYLLKPNMTDRELAAFFRHQINSASLVYSKITASYPGKPKLPELSNVSSVPVTFWLNPNSVGMLFFERVTSGIHINKKFRLQAYISALRLKTALRVYEQKHGQLPDELSALAPEFVREIPEDPYGDKPFRYSKEKKRVWSVGLDGVDNHGEMDAGRIMGLTTKKGCDLVMPLGTREMKPNLATPLQPNSDPVTSGTK